MFVYRQYQNGIKPKLIEGISIEYRSANALDEMELSTAGIQPLESCSASNLKYLNSCT